MMAMPLAAQAQTGPDFSGTLTLGYSDSSLSGAPGVDTDLSKMTLEAETDMMFGRAFGVGLDFGFATGTLDVAGAAADVDTDLIGFAVEPVYHLGNGAYAGAYYRMYDLDFSTAPAPVTAGVDTESYGLFGGYESGPLWVEGFIGTSDTDPGLPGNVDIMDYGVAASYEMIPEATVFGAVVQTDVDAPGPDGDVTAWAIGADYEFNNGLLAYGSVGRFDIGVPGTADLDANSVAIGVAYDLSQYSGTPVVLSAEYSHAEIDSGAAVAGSDIDRFAVGVTIPFGGGSSDPLNSNTGTARGDYRSAISALVDSL